MIAAHKIDANENDCYSGEDPSVHYFAGPPSDEDGDHGVDVGIRANLGDGNVPEQPIEGDEAQQGAEDQHIEKAR